MSPFSFEFYFWGPGLAYRQQQQIKWSTAFCLASSLHATAPLSSHCIRECFTAAWPCPRKMFLDNVYRANIQWKMRKGSTFRRHYRMLNPAGFEDHHLCLHKIAALCVDRGRLSLTVPYFQPSELLVLGKGSDSRITRYFVYFKVYTKLGTS